MVDPRDAGLAKIDRAKQHIGVLDTEVRVFLTEDPYRIIGDFDRKANRYILQAKIDKTPPQQDWGTIIGDCLHNLRSSLDHLAWSLARLHRDPPPDTTEFPIFRNETKFKKARRSKIGGIDPTHQTVIEELQPYNGSDIGKTLWLLHRLSNRDKHRLLNVAGSVLEGSTYRITNLKYVNVGFEKIVSFGPFEDGAVVGEFSAIPWRPDAEVDMEVEYRFGVAFDQEGPAAGLPLVPTLGELGVAVLDVQKRFAHLFEE
jgi:hypothetical protein